MPAPPPKRMEIVEKENPAYDKDIPGTLETLLTLARTKKPRSTPQGVVEESLYEGLFRAGATAFTGQYTMRFSHGMNILEIILHKEAKKLSEQRFSMDLGKHPIDDNHILVAYTADLRTVRITPTDTDVSYVDADAVDTTMEAPAVPLPGPAQHEERPEPVETPRQKATPMRQSPAPVPASVLRAQTDHLKLMQERIKETAIPESDIDAFLEQRPRNTTYEYDDLEQESAPEYTEKDIMQPGLASDSKTRILPYRQGRKEYVERRKRTQPKGTASAPPAQKQPAEVYQHVEGQPPRPVIVRGEPYLLDDVYNAVAAADGEEARDRLRAALIAIDPHFTGRTLLTGRMLEGAMKGITTIEVVGVPWQYDLIPEERAHRIAHKQHKDKEYKAWLMDNLRTWEAPEAWTGSYSPVHRFIERTADGLAEMRYVETKELARILK